MHTFKSLLLLSAFYLLTVTTYAQPVLTASNTLQTAGERYLNFYCDTTGFSPGSSGANVTWNFTNLSVTDSGYIAFKQSSSSLAGNVFTSSIVADSSASTFYSSNNLPMYNYWYADTSKVQLEGTLNDTQFLHYYIDPKEILHFPFSMNDSFADSFGYTHGYLNNYTTTGPALWSGEIIVKADAYGTLQLPNATYTNVLRIHRHSILSLGGSTPVMSPRVIDEYIWYSTESSAYPVFTVIKDSDLWTVPRVNVHQYKVYYSELAPYPVSINKTVNNINSFDIIPNPNNGTFNIKTTARKNTVYSIINTVGKTVEEGVLKGTETTISLSEPAGLYFLKIATEEGQNQVKRIIVQ